MPIAHLLPYSLVWRRAWRVAGLLGLLAAAPTAAQVQHIPPRPDSVVVPSPVRPDSLPPAPVVPAEPPPDAEPTPGPVRGRARWTILGACALLTISTFLLYNVRSR